MSINKKLRKQLFWGWAYLIFGFVGFLTWASTYPLEQGVMASGYVVSNAEKITIISPVNGLVKHFYKKQGDRVVKGELLIDFDISVMEHSLKSTKQSILGATSSNKSLKNALKAKMEQVETIEKQFEANKKLTEAGFLSKAALLQIQNQLSLAESEALEIRAELDRNVSRELELKEQLLGVNQQINLQKVLSPVNGSIMNVSIKSKGVNVTQGQALMDLVPDDDSLIVDARLSAEFIDRIKVGDEVDVMFPTLTGNKTIHFKGRLDYISADKIIDQRSNMAYFESRISILPKDGSEIVSVRVGLPATVIIKTGSRTLLSYILRPLVDRVALGFK